MDTEQFRKYGKEMVDYICNYVDNKNAVEVLPSIDAGYLSKLIPDEAPIKGESFDKILEDVETKIMPGIVHWNHPNFFAYFPAGNSFPSILGEMLSAAFGTIGFSWASSPAATELETIMLNWYAKALDLPKFFLSDEPGSIGGGALQGSASECVLVAMIAARARAINELKGKTNNTKVHDSIFLPQLVAYSSKEAHSSIEKAAKMSIVRLRILETDKHGVFRGDSLQKAIENDIASGLTPFFVVATLGTTGACNFDNVAELGQVVRSFTDFNIWLHIDAAYAGNSFICPELRPFKRGVEFADSFATNPNKFLLTNFDASAFWVKDVRSFTESLTVNPLYLQHEHASAIDYRHYGIALSRRFRSLKLWFVFRTYGIAGLQKYIRNHITLAKRFRDHVLSDGRFEVNNDVHLGLVCFRMIINPDTTKQLDYHNDQFTKRINETGKIHVVPAMVRGVFTIRFCVTYEFANEEHIDNAWKLIKELAEEYMNMKEKPSNRILNRSMSRQFNLTRSLSRDVYERQASITNLTDESTPIFVMETNDFFSSLDRATELNKTKFQFTNGASGTNVTNGTGGDSPGEVSN